MGVKSLWSLLEPVGRPVPLENIEGKALAIDSSIWIYQFQATMRDKDGRALVNAHVVGFLRRICKLLFYGIRPVFVFDGGAPALKRNTITERKKKKSGAAASHAKIAERLLAAHMRREALLQAHSPPSKTAKGKEKAPSGRVVLDEGAVYLEDIDGSVARTPAKQSGKAKDTQASPLSSKKNRFHEHDPYRLPEVDLEERVAKVTRSNAPDPRLATEEELRTFIEEMRPEDLDVSSPAFRELPTEVQYEIIGDLRLKSRQTSYKRLQNMLRKAETPLDFSKEQIKNLKQRNELTQQLLTTTDSIGKAHLTIPVRIASERNREYVLVKNEGADGGWVLGIRDDGTRAKPIEIDQDEHHPPESGSESDMEMEEVAIPRTGAFDPDLREYQRTMALSVIGKGSQDALPSRPVKRKPKPGRLFDVDEDDEFPRAVDDVEDDDDPELALAIQASLDGRDLPGANVASSSRVPGLASPPRRPQSLPDHPQTPPRKSVSTLPSPYNSSLSRAGVARERLLDDYEDMYASPSRLETALSIAGAGPSRRPSGSHHDHTLGLTFGKPSLLTSPQSIPQPLEPVPSVGASGAGSNVVTHRQEPAPTALPPPTTMSAPSEALSSLDKIIPDDSPDPTIDHLSDEDSDGDMDEIYVGKLTYSSATDTVLQRSEGESFLPSDTPDRHEVMGPSVTREALRTPEPVPVSPMLIASPSKVPEVEENDDDPYPDWSRSPSPVPMDSTSHEAGAQPTREAAAEGWDAAHEMDAHAEEGEFARFISQVKGKDLDVVRHEIDEEIRTLNQQKKAAMRDSEDITQQMISQIMLMLRLFGIPYITAPMEAEAQCAELASLGLVEGIITDDSDVFLFGGLRVFKNMFNQSKTVECFLLSDLSRELGLDQDTLIRLAYLLGSDYVEGLPGVGPVVAMEMMKEFPGEDGLHKFKDWWTKVQSGRDKEEDSKTKFRTRFKKRFKDLYLPQEWPNALVRDAYYHPTVDSSEEPFKWGMPDLDALRGFLREELGWNQTKVDDLLLPIIQKMNKRNQAASSNRQGNLNGYLDVAAGTGSYAPRKRQAYGSKRLQQVVSDFRKQQAKGQAGVTGTPSPEANDTDAEEVEPEKKKRKKTASTVGEEKRTAKSGKTRSTGNRRGRGRGGRPAARTSSFTKTGDIGSNKQGSKNRGQSADDFEGDENNTADMIPSRPLEVKLRPRPKPLAKGSRNPDLYGSNSEPSLDG
ncbi:PIN domain-like protein [Leucogyrophana mollusca]|uniref:PIN domain-like protein n=1 Tax=Leucogyrophana mollusca TaxID=85980 RepID=A0ACB8BX31_9AGAM|nr:PIN domain-like protein [Leucogyrophana mollusca]